MTTTATDFTRFDFTLPESLEASEPPEARGVARDGVRMLVTERASGSLVTSTFRDLPAFLRAGDLVVINTSGTIPAALDALTGDGISLVVHLSTQLDVDRWVVEPRRRTGRATERWRGPVPSRLLHLRGGVTISLDEPYGDSERLWVATLRVDEPILDWLATHASPIRYGYVERTWPIETYQTVYATELGSAEMPSAGRPFTPEIITRLVAIGVGVVPLILHTGVASLENDELPYAERVKVPVDTAERVNAARRLGRRVIAVGTTVVRALETSVGPDGLAHPVDGWTEHLVTPESGVRIVDGLLTGWHEPVSSHLLMLETLLGRALLEDSYHAALVQGFRWHEFGDTHLIVP